MLKFLSEFDDLDDLNICVRLNLQRLSLNHDSFWRIQPKTVKDNDEIKKTVKDDDDIKRTSEIFIGNFNQIFMTRKHV